MEIKDLLPIGSVVRLKEGEKRLMVFGVKQINDEQLQSDYVGVLYPEGNMGTDYQYLFSHDSIDEIYFRGFEDEERDEFLEMLDDAYKSK